MAGWIGPTVAISLLVIAACVAVMTYVMVRVAREAEEGAEETKAALAELRERVDPLVDSLQALTNTGTETLDIPRHASPDLATPSPMARSRGEGARCRTTRALADFDALVEVMQEEVEETALDVAVALQTVRASTGMVGRMGRLLSRRHRDEDDE